MGVLVGRIDSSKGSITDSDIASSLECEDRWRVDVDGDGEEVY